MVTITTNNNKIIIDVSSLDTPWNNALKVTYGKSDIRRIELIRDGYITVKIQDEPETWRITTITDYTSLDDLGKQITIPISNIDGVDITTLDQLYTTLSNWKEYTYYKVVVL